MKKTREQYAREVAVEQLAEMAKGLDVEAAVIVETAKTKIEKLIQMEASK